MRFKDHSLKIWFYRPELQRDGEDVLHIFWKCEVPAGEDRPLSKCVSRDSASLNGREGGREGRREGGREGWVEGFEHRGEACLGFSPTGTPIDDVEWKRSLFTLHIKSSFSRQTVYLLQDSGQIPRSFISIYRLFSALYVQIFARQNL